jgi:hypothetical protein
MTRQEAEARRLECKAREAESWAVTFGMREEGRVKFLEAAAGFWGEAAKAWSQVPAEQPSE